MSLRKDTFTQGKIRIMTLSKEEKVALRLMGNRCKDCDYYDVFRVGSMSLFGFCKGLVVPEEGCTCCPYFKPKEEKSGP